MRIIRLAIVLYVFSPQFFGRVVPSISAAYGRRVYSRMNTNVLRPLRPQSRAERAHILKLERCFAFMDRVQGRTNIDVVRRYMELMTRFREGQLNHSQVIATACHLFRSYPDLLLEFNAFLPDRYEIWVTRDKATGKLKTAFLGPQGFVHVERERLTDVQGAQVLLDMFRSSHK